MSGQAKSDTDHVAATPEHLAQLHREMDEATPEIQKLANIVTRFLGRPALVPGTT